MGRELIYPGDKQIKALLSPARRRTTAYINILSWAIQVSKGLIHLHFHKSPLSTPWPPLPVCSTRQWAAAVLFFSTLVLLFSSLLFSRHVCLLFTVFLHLRIFIVNSERSKILIPSDTGVSLADRQGGRSSWKTELSWHLWTRCNDLWTRAGFKL